MNWYETGESQAIQVAEASELDTPNAEWLQKKQQKLFAGATQVLEDALAFRELSPDATKPPDAWIASFGEEEAWRRFHVAMGAWQNAKEAPVGIKVSKELVVGISKALAQKGAPRQQINMQFVKISADPPEVLPEMKVDR